MSIKLEIGKKYVCRNGAVVGPLEKNPVTTSSYLFLCDVDQKVFRNQRTSSWAENGEYRIGHGNDDYDIVAEYHEYVWKWMVPDKPVVWMNGGSDKTSPHIGKSNMVYDMFVVSTWPEGWYCFLMDIPQIQMPPKQRVTKRLWLRKIETTVLIFNQHGEKIPCSEVYEERWISAESPIPSLEWISTNVTKEVEE